MDDRPTVPVSRLYTNHANVYAGPFDIVLEAGMRGLPGDEVQIHTALVMSPQMAKVVARLLTHTIQQWEAKHGEITVPGQVTTRAPSDAKLKPS
ncbi:MAG TPA: hypothetical protein DHW14_05140 [Clostridiales bacterium]|nr:hypothetical protein [Clostridiales bacterium]